MRSSFRNGVLALNPLGYFPLQETTGSTQAVNLADATKPGVYINGPALTAIPSPIAGECHHAVPLFDGVNDFVHVDDNTLDIYDSLSPISVLFWMYALSTGESDKGTVWGGSQNQTYFGRHFGYRSATEFGSIILRDTTHQEALWNTAAIGLNLNQWHFVVITWDGGLDVSEDFKMYLDGHDVGTATGTDGEGDDKWDNNKHRYIGSVNGGYSYSGYLCHFAIFESVLTAQQVCDLYMAGRARPRRADR